MMLRDYIRSPMQALALASIVVLGLLAAPHAGRAQQTLSFSAIPNQDETYWLTRQLGVFCWAAGGPEQ